MRRLVLLVGVCMAIATPAFAHVEVSPETSAKNGSGTFTFNVEDERDRANEVTVEIFLPAGVSADSVTPSGPAAWEFAKTTSPSVRFTHAAPGPDGDQSFTLAISSLPDADQLVFKVLVTYDNGETDRWIDEPTGGKEPPHPAAVVQLTGTAPSTVTTAAPGAPVTTVPRPDKGSNKGVIGGVILAAVVVLGGLIAYATRRGGSRPAA